MWKKMFVFLKCRFNEKLQGITNGEALKGGEDALAGNLEALNDDTWAL